MIVQVKITEQTWIKTIKKKLEKLLKTLKKYFKCQEINKLKQNIGIFGKMIENFKQQDENMVSVRDYPVLLFCRR